MTNTTFKTLENQQEVLQQDSWYNHYVELRTRVFLCVLSLLITTIISFNFADTIYSFLASPLVIAMDQELGSQALVNEGEKRKLIFTSLTEGFITQMRVAFFFGFILAFPLIAAQIYLFIAPGLYKKEKKVLLPYLIAAPILFLIGAAFAYYLVMPIAWNFFLGFEGKVVGDKGIIPIQLEAKIGEYLDIVIDTILAFGIAFQLPIALTLLVRVGILEYGHLIKSRRYAIVIIFIVAAILTPPDVLSQISLAIPMVLLYEVSIILCKFLEKKRKSYN